MNTNKRPSQVFSPGDVVFLKSGSPAMTVSDISDSSSVICAWFNDGKRMESATFAELSLTKDSRSARV